MTASNGESPVGSNEEQDAALWDANDVARFLKTSRSWVYQRAQAGELPCLKIGGLLRFEPAAIRAFIKNQNTDGRKVVPFSTEKKRP
ncbi:helix-turn-helix domain-containing protein [Myxococcus sp. AM010]|uniref:helix-turn-helix domain-containing protein n=1 Tax=Myxococcus sp. AM010 TaxID=2745138 RepID=UPI001595DE79|nr:helix-turn-helix domain-containing protein [Myxococcus sp. AM010]NVJ15324.1 helix-turn-helix domain-containing protein [Myxococcus sp. AM010]